MAARQRPAARPELLRLLTAAKQDAADIAPRLVLSDWLEEHGDDDDRARADLIRLQVRKPLPSPYEPATEDGPADALVEARRGAWLVGLPEVVREDCHFERGMVRLEANAVANLAGATPLPESAWWIERLVFRGGSVEVVPELPASPYLAQAHHFAMPYAQLGGDGAAALTASPAVGHLVGLDLNHDALGDDGAAALAASPHLGNVRSLELWVNAIGPAGARALAGAVSLRGLRGLNLGGNRLGPEGMAALVDSPLLRELETFLVWDNQLGPEGARALTRAAMPNLRRLYLNQNQLGPEGAAALKGWGPLGGLRLLAIWSNGIGAAGLRDLLGEPLGGLRALLLGSSDLGDDAALALAEATTLGGLRRLDLSSNRITDTGARALFESPGLAGLQQLSLSGNGVSKEWQERIAERFQEGPVSDESHDLNSPP